MDFLRDSMVGFRCLCVVTNDAWPKRYWISCNGTPRSARREPHSCLRSCQRRSPSRPLRLSVIPAPAKTFCQALRKYACCSPTALPNVNAWGPRNARCSKAERRRVVAIGMRRSFLLLALGAITRLSSSFQSTYLFCKRSISPHRIPVSNAATSLAVMSASVAALASNRCSSSSISRR